ncbi:hypothetical protein TRVL_04039 [Trypanosoma vivax]|nr:hypothetical protein TRVL_04039 [Trypanosoma vivax]
MESVQQKSLKHTACSSDGGDVPVDNFGGMLADFGREVRGMTQRLLTQQRLQKPQSSSGPSNVRRSSLFAHAPLVKKSTVGKRAVEQLPASASCVQNVALNVWDTLGFFSQPPFDTEPVTEARDSPQLLRRPDAQRPKAKGRSPIRCDSGMSDSKEARWKDVLFFVSTLREYYERLLKPSSVPVAHEAVDDGTSEAVGGGSNMLRQGLWRVLFNATFYCATVPGPRSKVVTLDLESAFCASTQSKADLGSPLPSGVTSRPNSPTSVVNGPEESARFYSENWCEEGEVKEMSTSGAVQVFPVRLQWCRTQLTDMDSASERRQMGSTGVASTTGEEESHCSQTLQGHAVGRSGKKITSSFAAREEVNSHPRDCEMLFTRQLNTPIPIIPWIFVLRTMAQLGYKRDVFYVQTPLHASVHELLLALLWLTGKFQLIAVAEHVQFQLLYPFLLQQCHSSEGIRTSADAVTEPVDGSGVDCAWRRIGTSAKGLGSELKATGKVLERCFTQAVPWPPASFVEREHVARRLKQQQRLIPTETSLRRKTENACGTMSTCLPDLSRQLLSIRRLITLSLNRLENTLHQRAEQIIALGLHSDVDVQLCHPELHDTYLHVCGGLRHLSSMEERLREASEQLSRLGALVAWAIQREQQESGGVSGHDTRDRKGSGCATVAVMEAIARDKVEEELHCSREMRCKLRDSIERFMATRRRQELRELSAHIRRSARVSDERAPHDDNALESTVRLNMRSRYSLEAALCAELVCWQTGFLSRVPLAASKTVPCGEDGSECGGDTAIAERGALLGTFGLITGIESDDAGGGYVCRAQATAVGRPVGGGTTSAQLEMQRLQEVLTHYQEVCREKRNREGIILERCMAKLRLCRLRTVPRTARQ